MPNASELAETLIAAVDRAGIGVTVLAQRGDHMERVYASSGLSELTGYPPDELASLPVAALADPEDRPRLAAMADALMTGGPQPPHIDSILLAKSGERIPVEAKVAYVQASDGVCCVLFFRDLRPSLRIQSALRESEARFRSLAEASPDSITVSVRGKFVYANPATASVLGYDSPDELLGRSLAELLIDQSEVEVMRERIARVVAGEKVAPREYAGRKKDGGLAVLEISSKPITYDGQPAILAIGRDTTERRALNAELMRADRLATLGMLSAGVAHEINNPLTYTLLHLERLALTLPALIADPAARKKVETMLAEAREGGDRVRTMVRELLTVARHDHGSGPSAVEPAIDTAIRLAHPTIAGRARACRRGEPAPRVGVNTSRLSQVFLNLVLNAADAFDQPDDRNEIVIDVVHANAEVVVTVRDNGRGIPPEVLPQVFEPLFTTKPVGIGTGLGLWICRSILAENGGTVTATSEVGVGTQMIVRLPVA